MTNDIPYLPTIEVPIDGDHERVEFTVRPGVYRSKGPSVELEIAQVTGPPTWQIELPILGEAECEELIEALRESLETAREQARAQGWTRR